MSGYQFSAFEIGQIKAHLYHSLGATEIARIIVKPDRKSHWSDTAVQKQIDKLTATPRWRGQRQPGSGAKRVGSNRVCAVVLAYAFVFCFHGPGFTNFSSSSAVQARARCAQRVLFPTSVSQALGETVQIRSRVGQAIQLGSSMAQGAPRKTTAKQDRQIVQLLIANRGVEKVTIAWLRKHLPWAKQRPERRKPSPAGAVQSAAAQDRLHCTALREQAFSVPQP